MGIISNAQHWLIELMGTIFFLSGAGLLLYGLFVEFQHGWYIDLTVSVVGMYMMGYKAIPDKIKELINK